MQDAFEQASTACLGEEICSLDHVYTQEELDIFNEESKEFYEQGYIDGGADIPTEISNITFLGYFLLCFEEGQKYQKDIEAFWQHEDQCDYEWSIK